ncbi:MAG: alpha-glucan family phosphorylase [Bdellovibrionota bacterium]
MESTIAYFSMEIAVDPEVPTYAGGLGVLAGDTLRAAADLEIPMIACTLLHRRGYFHQRLAPQTGQQEEPVRWSIEDCLRRVDASVSVQLEGRSVALRAWRFDIRGLTGFVVPVYFLDSDVEPNSSADRRITDSLYGGDNRTRLFQEAILGIGGVRMLRALGHRDVQRYHMNEGHSSLLTLELLDEQLSYSGRSVISQADISAVRRKCVFTTHTPVPAGHDQFPLDLVKAVLGDHEAFELNEVFCWQETLNMTYLALSMSHYVNGVAKRHGEVSQQMFANYRIDSITNGVHAATWVSPALAKLYDQHVHGWREDNFSLRYALRIPREELWMAHFAAKHQLIEYVNRETNAGFDLQTFTVGIARRFTPYKRPTLILSDLERLEKIAAGAGTGIQILFAGKAHPADAEGKRLLQEVLRAAERLQSKARIAFVPDYDLTLAKLLVSGVDLWVNTPEPPLEASGTSGMKAALNGVPSLSVLDGWWIEGCIEGVTGWPIGSDGNLIRHDYSDHAELLYVQLEHVILPMFYQHREKFLEVMCHCIALNGSFFNTQRMLQQYVQKAYS